MLSPWLRVGTVLHRSFLAATFVMKGAVLQAERLIIMSVMQANTEHLLSHQES